MIRINLLEVRPRSAERLDSILSSGRSSTFISRREAVVGALFLVLTVAILGVLVSRFSPGEEETERTVAAAEESLKTFPEVEIPAADTPSAETYAPEASAQTEEPPEDSPVEPAVETPAAEAAAEEPPAPAANQPPAPAAALDDGGEGYLVSTVRATPLSDRVDVFLEIPDAPPVNSFRVDGPPRLVFDIPGALLLASDPERTQRIDSPLVSRLRIAQNTIDPPLVRLVLELGEAPAKAEVSTSAAGVSIRVTAIQ
jgi:hypothetical protein